MILTDYFRSTHDMAWDCAIASGVKHGVIRLPEDGKFLYGERSHWDALVRRFTDFGITPVVIEPMPSGNTSSAPEPRTVAIPKSNDVAKPRFIPPHTAEEQSNAPAPDEDYIPENALIHKVRIYRWKSDYRYYESFVRDAVRLYAIKGVECPRVSFFSYVPQYSQM